MPPSVETMVKVSGIEACGVEPLTRRDQNAHVAGLIGPDLDDRIAARARLLADGFDVGMRASRDTVRMKLRGSEFLSRIWTL